MSEQPKIVIETPKIVIETQKIVIETPRPLIETLVFRELDKTIDGLVKNGTELREHIMTKFDLTPTQAANYYRRWISKIEEEMRTNKNGN